MKGKHKLLMRTCVFPDHIKNAHHPSKTRQIGGAKRAQPRVDSSNIKYPSNKPTSIHNSSFLSRKCTSRENGCVSSHTTYGHASKGKCVNSFDGLYKHVPY